MAIEREVLIRVASDLSGAKLYERAMASATRHTEAYERAVRAFTRTNLGAAESMAALTTEVGLFERLLGRAPATVRRFAYALDDLSRRAFAIRASLMGVVGALGAYGGYRVAGAGLHFQGEIDLALQRLATEIQREGEGFAAARRRAEKLTKWAIEYKVKTPFALDEIMEALSGFTILYRGDVEKAKRAVQVAALLASKNPEQGLRGAFFALQEAEVGYLRSPMLRFRLPKGLLEKHYKETGSGLEAVARTLKDIRVTQDMIFRATDTAPGLEKQIHNLYRLLYGQLMTGVYQARKEHLRFVRDRMRDLMDERSTAHKLIQAVSNLLGKLASLYYRFIELPFRSGEKILRIVRNLSYALDPIIKNIQAFAKGFATGFLAPIRVLIAQITGFAKVSSPIIKILSLFGGRFGQLLGAPLYAGVPFSGLSGFMLGTALSLRLGFRAGQYSLTELRKWWRSMGGRGEPPPQMKTFATGGYGAGWLPPRVGGSGGGPLSPYPDAGLRAMLEAAHLLREAAIALLQFSYGGRIPPGRGEGFVPPTAISSPHGLNLKGLAGQYLEAYQRFRMRLGFLEQVWGQIQGGIRFLGSVLSGLGVVHMSKSPLFALLTGRSLTQLGALLGGSILSSFPGRWGGIGRSLLEWGSMVHPQRGTPVEVVAWSAGPLAVVPVSLPPEALFDRYLNPISLRGEGASTLYREAAGALWGAFRSSGGVKGFLGKMGSPWERARGLFGGMGSLWERAKGFLGGMGLGRLALPSWALPALGLALVGGGMAAAWRRKAHPPVHPFTGGYAYLMGEQPQPSPMGFGGYTPGPFPWKGLLPSPTTVALHLLAPIGVGLFALSKALTHFTGRGILAWMRLIVPPAIPILLAGSAISVLVALFRRIWSRVSPGGIMAGVRHTYGAVQDWTRIGGRIAGTVLGGGIGGLGGALLGLPLGRLAGTLVGRFFGLGPLAPLVGAGLGAGVGALWGGRKGAEVGGNLGEGFGTWIGKFILPLLGAALFRRIPFVAKLSPFKRGVLALGAGLAGAKLEENLFGGGNALAWITALMFPGGVGLLGRLGKGLMAPLARFFVPALSPIMKTLSPLLSPLASIGKGALDKGMAFIGPIIKQVVAMAKPLVEKVLAVFPWKRVTGLAVRAFTGVAAATSATSTAASAAAGGALAQTLSRLGYLRGTASTLVRGGARALLGAAPAVAAFSLPFMGTSAPGSGLPTRGSGEAKAVAAIMEAIARTETPGGRGFGTVNSIGALGFAQVMPYNLLGIGWDKFESMKKKLGRIPTPQEVLGPNWRNMIGERGKGWDYEALGRDVTPEEFLSNPEIQRAIVQHKLGQYYERIKGAGLPQHEVIARLAGAWNWSPQVMLDTSRKLRWATDPKTGLLYPTAIGNTPIPKETQGHILKTMQNFMNLPREFMASLEARYGFLPGATPPSPRDVSVSVNINVNGASNPDEVAKRVKSILERMLPEKLREALRR